MGNAQRKETPSLDWTLGDRLGKSLKFAGVSAQEMADYLGVARNTVSNYVNDHTMPSKLARKEWALRTGVSLDYLENGTDPTNMPPLDYKAAGSVTHVDFAARKVVA